MRGVKIAGWLIILMVLALLATDLWSVIYKNATHPVVSWEHVALVGLALLGIGMASDETANRIARMAASVRGRKEDAEP